LLLKQSVDWLLPWRVAREWAACPDLDPTFGPGRTIGVLSQHEGYKGPVDEVRFGSRAKTAQEIGASWAEPVSGT